MTAFLFRYVPCARMFMFSALLCIALTPSLSFAEGDKITSAKTLVKVAGEHFIAALADESAGDSGKAETFKALIKRYTDYRWMAGFVAGRSVKDASEQDKNAYFDLYPGYLVKTYLPKYGQFKDREQRIIDGKEDGDKIVVRTSISNGNQAPIDLRYYVRFRDGKPLIFDVLAEGVSLIITQRSEFSSYIQRKGFSAFVERMKTYNAS